MEKYRIPFDTSLSERSLSAILDELREEGIELEKLEKFLKEKMYKRFVTFIGGPQITGSFSPLIHTLSSLKLSSEKALLYTLIIVENTKQSLEEILDEIESNESILGSNVTMPYKEKVFEILNKEGKLDESAIVAGAVNTLAKDTKKGGIIGYNTDIDGITGPIIEKIGEDFSGKNACILGAGGAARGAIAGLLQKGVKHITLFNRSIENAQKLKDYFLSPEQKEYFGDDFKIDIVFYDLENDKESSSLLPYIKENTILINSLPFGFKENYPSMPIKEEEIGNFGDKIILYFDMVYDKNEGDTPLTKKFKELYPDMETCDGVDMLIGQAIKGFELWTGEELDTNFIKKLIRTIISKNKEKKDKNERNEDK